MASVTHLSLQVNLNVVSGELWISQCSVSGIQRIKDINKNKDYGVEVFVLPVDVNYYYCYTVIYRKHGNCWNTEVLNMNCKTRQHLGHRCMISPYTHIHANYSTDQIL